jgi:hypothetical protein
VPPSPGPGSVLQIGHDAPNPRVLVAGIRGIVADLQQGPGRTDACPEHQPTTIRRSFERWWRARSLTGKTSCRRPLTSSDVEPAAAKKANGQKT